MVFSILFRDEGHHVRNTVKKNIKLVLVLIVYQSITINMLPQNPYNDYQFTDVTLVCEYGQPVQAHKGIHSASRLKRAEQLLLEYWLCFLLLFSFYKFSRPMIFGVHINQMLADVQKIVAIFCKLSL